MNTAVALSSADRVWSVQQQAIFEFCASGAGNLVVRARAGTGKTTTIVEALKYFQAGLKVLLAAFNRRIALELEGRIASEDVEVKTLHALGFAFIRRQWQCVTVDALVDADRAIDVCGPQAPDAMVAMVKKLAGLLKNVAPFGGVDQAVDVAIDFDCEPDDEWVEEGWTLRRVAELAIKARDAAKVRDARGRLSFDDMIFIPLANGFARPWFDVVVIDEAQDMNYAQLLLAQRACKRSGRIVVVGDDRQAIYGFRGADSNGIDRLKGELRATELGLTVTYRCGKRIVGVAKEMVPDYEAAPTAHEGLVDVLQTELLVETAKPGDFVLSRKNAPLMGICLSFLRKGVPARIEGRDVAEGLRAIVKKFKAKSVPDFIKKVGAWEAKQIKRFSADPKFAAKLDQARDQAETLVALAEGCASVAEVLGRLDSLFVDSDGNASKNMVVCSSVHKAKGLEADRVFVLADTVNTRNVEEQNIYYVAVTRAKRHLTWVTSK